MKVQYCSDLHLEFQENFKFIQTLPLEARGDVLILAGDIAYLNDTTIPNIRFWKWASKNYRHVLMVAGNHEFTVKTGMNDYRQILYHKHRLHPKNINDEFEKNLAFIKQAVETSKAEKIVVVTHHLPTFAAIEDRYKGDVLNVAFATELGDYIADSRINAWIYGHAHHRTDLYIGHTHLVSNPLGYIFAGEGVGFDESATLDI